MRTPLSKDQLDHLSELGYLKLPAAIPADDAVTMRERMWDALAIGGAEPADRSSWRTVDTKALKRARQQGAFGAFASPTVRAVADQLLARWDEPVRWGLPLVTFPQDREWSVPHSGWHLDSSPRTGPGNRLIRIFALLGSHEAGGGATLVVSGSHRLVFRMSERIKTHTRLSASAIVTRTLASTDAWFDRLFRPGLEPERSQWLMTQSPVVDGIKVGVVEFTGQPGDVYLMHPWALHGGSPNCSDRPRMMVTMWLFRADDSVRS